LAAPQHSNIDGAEILKFEAVASRWWDKNGALRALHDINGTRVGYIDAGAGLRGKRVLDVGCGGGILSEAMALLGADVTGIDMGLEPLAVAKRHMQKSGLFIDYQRITVESYARRQPASFDVVTCLELLEHVPDPFSVVRACGAMVRPGGRVFFATLNRNLLSYLLAIVAAEYVLGLVPKGTHRYDRFVKPSELFRWARHAGLRPVDLSGFNYLPFIRRCTLGGKAAVNYLAHFRREA
jgi:2-polyprenyl-6-hydroxyphenyl methylase/3-demethylubiquinone-9 3-methyltransferase